MAIIRLTELLRQLQLKRRPLIFALAWNWIPIWWCYLRYSLSPWTQTITIVSIPVNNLVRLTSSPNPLMCKFLLLVSYTLLRLQLLPTFNMEMKTPLAFKTLSLRSLKLTIHIVESSLRSSVKIQISFSFQRSPKAMQES